MKKIRETFHMIAAAVFCIVMSMKERFLVESGQAMVFDAGNQGYSVGVLNISGNMKDSLMSRIKSKINNYIKKVFFWLRGPGDRSVMVLSGIPPIIASRFLIL